MQLCSAPVLARRLQLSLLGMSTECIDPWTGGPQSQTQSPGGGYGTLASGGCLPPPTSASWNLPRWRASLAAAVLCYINLLNYMNWFIIPGVLLDVQKYFNISDSHAGLLQTVFIGCLLVSAPVFGYLGDRHSRKAILCFGILLWSGAGLSSSFISYQDQRTCVLAVFYIFIPVGSGLGYVLGSVVAELTGNWRWALRIMPCLDAVALVLLILLVPDPPRGAAEKQEEVAVRAPRSSWCEDVRYLGRNWSFVFSTLGVTAIGFVTGALGFWAPKFLFEARVVHGLQLPCFQEQCGSQDRQQLSVTCPTSWQSCQGYRKNPVNKHIEVEKFALVPRWCSCTLWRQRQLPETAPKTQSHCSLIFGALTVATGIIGVILGAEASRRYKKVNPRAEPLICASSLFAAAPCLYLALILASRTLLASYVFLALGELLLSCNWAVVADILLSVVVPRCRGTAEALQITVAHILGDAGSPYLTGLISSVLQTGRPNSYLQRFLSLQHSFLCCAFAIVLGGGCFLLTALHLERDQAQARQAGKGTLDSEDVVSRNPESQGLLSSTSTPAEQS
ncbi:protein spinster homolog 3 isoform X3 [Microtus pennsylvanicus]|uniref:protein spinster homolog 3 isoform X3 n=1 Tax=Microtus pennsylvanicus TaxID=10058 RepID=UPI003F6C86A3